MKATWIRFGLVFSSALFAAASGCDQVLDASKPVGLHVDSVSPAQLPASGGVEVTLIGDNFDDHTKVLIGDSQAFGVVTKSAQQLTFIAPRRPFGPSDLHVENSRGQKADVAKAFTFYAEHVAFANETVAIPTLTPAGWALGDLNGDGLDDLLVGDFNTGKVTPFLNDGDGTHFTPRPAFDLLTGGQLELVDANGDGKLDVLSGSSLLLGTGQGDFGLPILLPVDAFAHQIGDFDGDGKPELALLSFTALTIADVGTNGLQPKVTTDIAAVYASMTAIDLDGDGTSEIIIADAATTGCLRVRHAPAFDAATEDQICEPELQFGPALVARDFNGDGVLDVLAQTASNGTFLLHGTGGGKLAAPVRTTSLCGASNFTGFITPTRPSKFLFANCGIQQFAAFSFASDTFSQLGTGDFAPQLGNLDGDPWLDAVALDNSGLTVRYGDIHNGTRFSPYPGLFFESALLNGQSMWPLMAPVAGRSATLAEAVVDRVSLRVRRTDGRMEKVGEVSIIDKAGQQRWVESIDTADLDGDGDTDLVLGVAELNPAPNAFGTFRSKRAVYVEGDTLTLGETFGNDLYGEFHLADVDGDGRAEAIFVGNTGVDEPNGRLVIFHHDGAAWSPSYQPLIDKQATFVDVDGDKDADLITFDGGNFWFHRNDTGTFAAPVKLAPFPDNAPGFQASPLFAASPLPKGGALLWVLSAGYYGSGLNGIARATLDTTGTIADKSFVTLLGSALSLGDIDGDQVLDAVVLGTSALYAFPARSAALTEDASAELDPTQTNAISGLVVADVDGDGLAEALYPDPNNPGKAVVIRNRGE